MNRNGEEMAKMSIDTLQNRTGLTLQDFEKKIMVLNTGRISDIQVWDSKLTG